MTSDYEKEQGAMALVRGFIEQGAVTRAQILELTDSDSFPEVGAMDVLINMNEQQEMVLRLRTPLFAKVQELFIGDT